jgi:hypothetical protein
MKLSVDLSLLISAVEKMGAAEIDFNIETSAPPLDPIDIELGKGLELSLVDIEFTNGLVGYAGRQVLLYIKDHNFRILQAIEQPQEFGRKFHIADCGTLRKMRHEGRFDRYVVTNDLSGIFAISGIAPDTGEEISANVKLNVCKNCLKYLNYHGYQQAGTQKKQIFNNFKISDFFDTYSSFFTHIPSGIANISSVSYAPDWNKISANYREKQRYCCEYCGVNLESAKHLLHVHHKNGIKSDNTLDNLVALCFDCHKKQPDHDHMFMPYGNAKVINKLRKEQNILFISSWNDIYRFVDVALYGLVGLLKERNAPLPLVGMKLDENAGVPAVILDLAWKKTKTGVSIDTSCVSAVRTDGWRIINMADCLDDIDKFVTILRR